MNLIYDIESFEQSAHHSSSFSWLNLLQWEAGEIQNTISIYFASVPAVEGLIASLQDLARQMRESAVVHVPVPVEGPLLTLDLEPEPCDGGSDAALRPSQETTR